MKRYLAAALVICLVGWGKLPALSAEEDSPVAAPALTTQQLRAVRSTLMELRRARTTARKVQLAKGLAEYGEPAAQMLRASLQADLDRIQKSIVEATPDAEWTQRVEQLREQLREMRRDAEFSQEKIKAECDPALHALQQLYTPFHRDQITRRLAAAQEQLLLLQDLLEQLKQNFQATAPALVAASAELSPSVERLLKQIQSIPELQLQLVTASNRQRGGKLPAEVVMAMQQLNEFRLLLGVPPLTVDAKLCEAADGHCRDMVEHDFFSHQSVVSGKETFSERAKQAGTTARAENIFMGSSNPQLALQGWYYSPPHHRNMLDENHQRFGLGHQGKRWTLMFGQD